MDPEQSPPQTPAPNPSSVVPPTPTVITPQTVNPTQSPPVPTASTTPAPKPLSSLYPEATHGINSSSVGQPPPAPTGNPTSPVQAVAESFRHKIFELLMVMGLATTAGAVYFQWYKLLTKILPNSLAVCSSTDSFTFACRETMAVDLFVSVLLFTIAAVITYLFFKKSHVLAYFYGGYFVALLVFLEIALVFNIQAIYKLRWLFDHGQTWYTWILPAIVALIFTTIFYVIIKFSSNLVKTIMGVAYIVLLILSLIFLPTLVNNFVKNQNDAGKQEIKNAIIEDVKNSEIPLITSQNYSGIFKLSTANAFLKKENLIPRFELHYDISNQLRNQADYTIVRIYKGSSNDFNPPTNCGDGSPSSISYKNTTTYPCKVVMTTKKGRQIYGYRSPAKLDYYKIDPKSDKVRLIQPDKFYIQFGEYVISFDDPAYNYDNESPLTPTEVEKFVDSLEPVPKDQIEQFTRKYILLEQLP